MWRGVGARWAWLGLAGALLATGAAKAQNVSYADRMPDVDRVIADYAAPDPTQSRIRQAAACHVMTDAVEAFMGARVYRGEWLGQEKARRDAYAKCVGDRVGTRPGDTRPMRRRITSGESDLRRDPKFVAEVTGRYLGPGDLQTYRRLAAARDAQLEGQMAQMRGERDADQAISAARRQKSMQVLYGMAGGVLLTLALTVWLLLRNVPGFRLDLQSEPPTLKARGRTFALHSRGGVVAQLDKTRQTHHVPGTTTYDGQGRYVSSTSGYNYTTTHDTVFLFDKAGAEHAMKLSNWDVTARGGHMLGALWGIPKGKQNGPYLVVWNFSIDRSLTDTHQLGRMLGVTRKTVVLTSLSLLILGVAWDLATHGRMSLTGYGLAVLGLIVGFIVRRVVNGGRVKRFEREIAPIRDRAKGDAEVALLHANGVSGA